MLLSALVIAGTLALWIAYVPSWLPFLDRIGVLDLVGIEHVEADEQGGGGWGGGGPATVVAEPVTEGRIDDRVAAIGDGRARRGVDVRSDATGQVVEIGFAPGGRVEEGGLIVRLDDEAERIALERAELMLADAREDVERLERLAGTGSVTEVRLREAELALRQAELALRQAEYDLSQRTIRAPIAGWTGVPDIEEGDRVTSGDVLVTITDRSEILIDFRVPERVASRIEAGMPLEARALALPGRTLEGEVHAVDATVDRASRTLRVQGRLPNEADLLRAGMAFEVALSFPGETLPAVDPLAVQWSGDGAYVWTVRDGAAVRVPVAIRQRNAESVLVEGELEIGEMVVTEGVQNLRPGAEVRIAEPRAALEAGARPL
ncbi:efflux RND transporter periplasmic adaptor subunit [Rhodosalinus halophilus]|uniref:efflux RND transporter periplasmic adaptor subunit n=1 Tax=Rhodosalinus halophilus TaxID=2259333 RepID=UPI001F43CF42|nr:efflux RND transporter periplasmic adaptor subunit [Rhodosalinus halophilus]